MPSQIVFCNLLVVCLKTNTCIYCKVCKTNFVSTRNSIF